MGPRDHDSFMNRSDGKRIVIVDGYANSSDLLHELLSREVECMHLQSSPAGPASPSDRFAVHRYDTNLGYLGKPETVAAALATLQPHAVIAGSRGGILFAERVARLLRLPANKEVTTVARFSRLAMIETTRRAGLLSPAQTLAQSPRDAHAWADSRRCWPILVTNDRVGSDFHERRCHTHRDIDAAFSRMPNQALLIQADVEGPEFLVNSVSASGAHYVTDIWTRRKGADIGVSEELHLLDTVIHDASALAQFAHRALSALGIENGAAHTRLRWCAHGPVLIDCVASAAPPVVDRSTSAAGDLATQAAVHAAFLAGAVQEKASRLRMGYYRPRKLIARIQLAMSGSLSPQTSRTVLRASALPSFHSFTRGGCIHLVHESASRIGSDIAQLRAWAGEDLTLTAAIRPTRRVERAHPFGAFAEPID